MTTPDPSSGPGPGDPDPTTMRVDRVPGMGRRRAIAIGAAGVAVTALIVALLVGPSLTGGPVASPLAAGSAAPASGEPGNGSVPVPGSEAPPGSASPASPGPAASPSVVPGPPGDGRIAVVRRDGTLVVVDDRGNLRLDLGVDGVGFGPPAWSPDGTRLAAIGSGPDGSGIRVYDLPEDAEQPPDPRTVYESIDRAPFYLSWSPDGGRLGFLANAEPATITLRTAFPDGAAATDGPAGDGILRAGSPLYFDWSGGDRLLLHVGFGADAFTGLVDLAGEARGDEVDGSGDFRSAVIAPDGESLAFVRGDGPGGPDGSVVVAERDGTPRHELAVVGPAAVAFDPGGGGALAVLAAEAGEPVGFPLGPLRVIAPDGTVTTLLDGAVFAFSWSPDGGTIAALRLAELPGGSEAGLPLARPAIARAAPVVEEPEPETEIHVTFVDTATGEVRSDRVVRLGRAYVSTVLPYFDQYALSHRIWSPDASAIVLPLDDADGIPTITVLGVTGDDRPIGDGIHAAWAP